VVVVGGVGVVVVVGGRVVVVGDDGGRGGGGDCDGGRGRVVVGLGRERVVVVRAAVVGTVVDSTVWAGGGGTCGWGAGLGSDDGTGNGSRLVSTTGELSPGSGRAEVVQPNTPSASAAVPAAIAAARGTRQCNEPAPLDGTRENALQPRERYQGPTNE
jgi:hypothetical protein